VVGRAPLDEGERLLVPRNRLILVVSIAGDDVARTQSEIAG
jgi:hypothetical protein